MMIDLLTLPAAEAERLAYAEGFTMAAELFARIAALEVERDALARELEELEDKAADDSLARWERDNGPADAYRQFFDDCFERLAGHYPAPSVTSDYDQSIIFAAIEKGEGGAE
jgi:hypothetical protein